MSANLKHSRLAYTKPKKLTYENPLARHRGDVSNTSFARIALAAVIVSLQTVMPAGAQEYQLDSSTIAVGEGIPLEESKRLRDFASIRTAESLALSRNRLTQLIEAAVAYSPAMREVAYNVMAAGQDLEAAKGAKMPQVTVTGQSPFSQGDIASQARANGKPAISLAAQYSVYDWGRIEANIRGREQAQLAAFARRALTNRQLAVDAATICLELNKQRAILTANFEYLTKLAALQDMIAKVVAEDTGRSSELIQVRSRALQAASQSELINSRVREIATRLERVLGKGKVALCENLEAGLMERPTDEHIINSLLRHPQLQILEAEYQQAIQNVAQVNASRKPQVTLRAEHGPLAPGVNYDNRQVISLAATVPLYDGNTLVSSERAALDRSSAALERIDTAKNQLSSDLRERARFAHANLQRARDFVSLLEVNDKVRKDFFLQWAALGRRSLFELLAIEAEQLTLQSGYFTALYDGMIGVANVRANLGELTDDLAK